jgi:hypothetical protein
MLPGCIRCGGGGGYVGVEQAFMCPAREKIQAVQPLKRHPHPQINLSHTPGVSFFLPVQSLDPLAPSSAIISVQGTCAFHQHRSRVKSAESLG